MLKTDILVLGESGRLISDVIEIAKIKFKKKSTLEKDGFGKNVILRSGLSLSIKICFICFKESPLKSMKNAFFFLKMFKFLS